jgi:septal ring factor EnvC (AmiA/AmiB activator)
MQKQRFQQFFFTLLGIVTFGAVALGVAFSIAPRFLYAQTADTSTTAASSADSSDVAAKRAALQAQLNQLDTEIDQTQGTLDTLHGQHTSLQNQIDTLTAQIKKSQLQLQATQLEIQALQSNITIHGETINTLSGELTNEQQSLGQIIRQTNEIDNYSLVEVALSSQDVSGFFGDLDSFDAIKQELNSSYNDTVNTRASTETEKSDLEDQQTQAQQLATEESLEEASIKSSQAQKQTLLSQTKGQEATEQGIYNTQKQTIAQVQAELFALAGSSGSISLPAAIALAKTAGAATGVEPALILGILKQETDIGKNVGTANYQDAMNPTRDEPVFLVIMSTLGLDPNVVKVSAAPSYGWGGAMGPAQFIPSTWACYGGFINTTTGSCGKGTDGTYAGPWAYSAAKDRIAKLAGHPSVPANPYNNLDAFTATALLMADNGATAQTPAADREAALRYFAGWGNADNPAYAFYGDDVMALTAQFQSDISTLGGS